MPINRIVFAVLAIGAVGSSLLAAPGSAQNQSASRTHPQGQGQGGAKLLRTFLIEIEMWAVKRG